MATFMLIAGGADIDKRVGNPKLAPVMFERYMAWIQRLRDGGRFVGSYKLHDQTGRRLTIRGGEVIDGPPQHDLITMSRFLALGWRPGSGPNRP